METELGRLVVAGLGNPTEDYRATRHNAGFQFLDFCAERTGARFSPGRGDYLAAETGRLVLVKPTTFMNLSGIAVSQALERYGWEPGRLLLVYDEADLPVGSARLRLSGSAGSHRGMGSVLYHLGTDEVPRLRIGIGRPDESSLKEHVLDAFAEEEAKAVVSLFPKLYEAVQLVADGETDRALELVNRREKVNGTLKKENGSDEE